MKTPLSLAVSSADWDNTPERMQSLVKHLLSRVEELENQFKTLSEANMVLKQENELLKERLKSTSQNSSKPPSQDYSKKKGTQKKGARQRGGQSNHPGKGRELYPPEACISIDNYYPTQCHHCGLGLHGEDADPYRVQKIELPNIEPVVREHRFHQLSCESCGALTRGWDDKIITSSPYGPSLTSLVGYLSSIGHQSHHQVQSLLGEVFAIKLSTGGINRLRAELSNALGSIVKKAGEYIKAEAIVNMDETGFSQGNADRKNPEKKKGWLWIVVTPLVSYFEVFLSRSQSTAQELLGEGFNGIVGSDRCTAYSWLSNDQRQVCWAHLKRDFTKISERTGASSKLGHALLKQQKLLFAAWYQVRDGTLSRADFIAQVKPIRAEVKRLLTKGAHYKIVKGEKTPLSQTMGTCKKMLTVEPAFWTFVENEGIEPTNNSAERALRPAVLWRKRSFGSNSKAGSQFVARMMTTVTSLKAQQRSVLGFLSEALTAYRCEQTPPSLLPAIGNTP